MDETFVIRYKDPLATNRLGEYAVTNGYPASDGERI